LVTADDDDDDDDEVVQANKEEEGLSDTDEGRDEVLVDDDESSSSSSEEESLSDEAVAEDESSDSDSDSDEEDGEGEGDEGEPVSLRTADSRALLRRLDRLGCEPVSARNVPGFLASDLTAQLEGFYRGGPLSGERGAAGQSASSLVLAAPLSPSPPPLMFNSALFGEGGSAAAFVREHRRGSSRDALEALERQAFAAGSHYPQGPSGEEGDKGS
jgi:hypothetical protein